MLAQGAPFLLASDAHIAFDVGRMDEVLAVCAELSVPEDRILNFDPVALLASMGLE